MSKELEALVDGRIEYYKATLSLAEGLGRLEEGRRLRETIEHFEEIKQALTPPTEKEVCEALSEYLEQDVKNINEMFYYGKDIQFTEICNTTFEDIYGNQLYAIYLNLPGHLITMISRFYEGKVKENERNSKI